MRANKSLRLLAALASLSGLLLVGGCDRYAPRSSAIEDTLTAASFEVPARPAAAATRAGGGGEADAASLRPELYPGGSAFPGAPAASAERIADGVQVNFDGAELRDVVKVILGDILGATYTIDSGLTGQIVLSSSGPLSERQLLGVLEAALQMHGAALTRMADGAYSVQLADLAHGGSRMTALGGATPPVAAPGTGVTIVPLRYVGAEAAAQLVQPLLSRPDQIRMDETRNLLLFVGSAAERQTVLDTLADLDVNWMAGRSVGIFPLRSATPEAMVPELAALVTPLNGNQRPSETVRFMPMARLNAVLVIASQPDQLREIERWIARLDRGNTVGMQFYVYQLQHVPAEDMAKILTETFSEVAPSPAGTGAATVFSQAIESSPSEVALANDPSTMPSPSAAAPAASGGTGSAQLHGVKIVPNKLNNTLLVRATPQAYQLIEATLRRLDTAPLQVLIEATIAEVTLNDTLRYGVQYFLNTGAVKAGFNTSTPTASGVSSPDLLSPLARLPGFNFVLTPGSSNITIDALSRITDVKVLSSPSIVVQDNSEATLNVGDEVPITTRSAANVTNPDAVLVNSIEYRDTGVILEVKPRISSNDIVALEIAQEVSRIATESTSSDSLTPTISQRKITSRINIQSGQTVVLGGLIQDSETRSNDKVPVLGDVPVLGNLFSSKNTQAVRTELIVFLTPRIIHNAEDARDVSEELRSRMRSVRPLGPAGAPTVEPLPGAPRPLEGQPLKPSAALEAPAEAAAPKAAAAPAAPPVTVTEIGAPQVPSEEPLEPTDVARNEPAPETPQVIAKPREAAVAAQAEVQVASRVIIPHDGNLHVVDRAPLPVERPITGNIFIPALRPGHG